MGTVYHNQGNKQTVKYFVKKFTWGLTKLKSWGIYKEKYIDKLLSIKISLINDDTVYSEQLL